MRALPQSTETTAATCKSTETVVHISIFSLFSFQLSKIQFVKSASSFFSVATKLWKQWFQHKQGFVTASFCMYEWSHSYDYLSHMHKSEMEEAGKMYQVSLVFQA